jgi:hypothetical protein
MVALPMFKLELCNEQTNYNAGLRSVEGTGSGFAHWEHKVRIRLIKVSELVKEQ